MQGQPNPGSLIRAGERKEEEDKLKTRRRCGKTNDGIEWIIVNGEWVDEKKSGCKPGSKKSYSNHMRCAICSKYDIINPYLL